MKAFEELRARGRRRRICRLARIALARYGVEEARLRPLSRFRQCAHVFKVTLPGRDRDSFVLRMYRPDFRSGSVIRSELRWLRAILRDTKVVVPQPVTNRGGDEVTTVSMAGVPAPRHCALTKWVAGHPRLRKNGPGVDALEKIGRLMARLHLHSQRFLPPEGFECPRWDWQGLFGPSSCFFPRDGLASLDPEAKPLFRAAMPRARRVMARLGTGPDVFGLVHGDLIQVNYIFHRGEARAIDFASFGCGHYLYDMGVTLLMLWPFDPGGSQREAFIRGYRDVRSFSPEHEEMLDLFIASRAVAIVRWLMGNDDLRTEPARRWVAKAIEGLRLWLAPRR